MEGLCETPENGKVEDPDLRNIRYLPFQPCTGLSLLWFDVRVFYVRVSNFQLDDSTPEFLTLNHIPLDPDTLLEVNGIRSSIYSDGVYILLRRDRVDKRSEEVTFVSTDNVRLTGSVKFEVFDKKDLILSGILEMSSSNGFIGESKNNVKQWSMNCESNITSGSGFLKGKLISSPKLSPPTIEVYVAGCFSGKPIILTKTLQLNYRKKHNRKGTLDAIPEYESTECQKDMSPELDMQFSEYRNYKPPNEEDYSNIFWRRTEYMDGEDGELSWFNAGVRVGVGIGLGVCLGVGIGVGLLVRTYQATTRSFKRRLI
ncbi:Erythronate-4-phosphate dehydrogenase family protein isoform 1 [Gossypium australe]|uniref:Erythronate-4-phosphate dehydrogenase family protein isoform 1 n=1 Tax=Gossypium australe TaxID=47621 RepID=A0A5B6X6U0_9ROSI|nr:Erythronate-4-phosphate dehydrogenase family protein isoform 1 [Gossypium australe]